jgi:hypothetical protein
MRYEATPVIAHPGVAAASDRRPEFAYFQFRRFKI